ncbi:MAG: nucleotidyltransferase domain-containing protein [Chloroflexota bacterium]|nr:nucleotidyltransferase domain-containing protein [Chloroflexota bacterium]
MNPLIQDNIEAIIDLCREYGVVRLEVFGSVMTDQFDSSPSDVDFIIEYPPDYDFGHWLHRYFELRERLESLLGRSVDLVMVDAMKPRFIAVANETRQLLYAA